jgi:hypothetical protein
MNVCTFLFLKKFNYNNCFVGTSILTHSSIIFYTTQPLCIDMISSVCLATALIA